MRTILVGIDDLGVRLAERLLSTTGDWHLLRGGTRLVLEMSFVDPGERLVEWV